MTEKSFIVECLIKDFGPKGLIQPKEKLSQWNSLGKCSYFQNKYG